MNAKFGRDVEQFSFLRANSAVICESKFVLLIYEFHDCLDGQLGGNKSGCGVSPFCYVYKSFEIGKLFIEVDQLGLIAIHFVICIHNILYTYYKFSQIIYFK